MLAIDVAAIIVTAVALAGAVVALVREWYPPAATLLGTLVALVVIGVVEPSEAFAGFSSSATLTVAGLFIVARAIRAHGGLVSLVGRLLGHASTDGRALVRLTVPVAVASSVIANTPLVAALAPVVRSWAERNGRAASHLLMPLSFASILGGVITTIGTSTTLVVSGLVETTLGEPFRFLEVTPVGLPVALAGIGVLIVLAPRVLPDRRSVYTQVATHERDYTIRLRVVPDGYIDGRSIARAHLRNLDNAYLAAVDRGGRRIGPVDPDTVLLGGDVLTLVGRVDGIRGLVDGEGLVFAEESQAELLHGDQHGLHEVVVGASSPLAGRTLKELSFRGRYGAAVLAVHRAGQRVEGKLGTLEIHAGDALLVMADAAFADRWQGRSDFAVVVPLDGDDETLTARGPFVLAVLIGLVVAAATGIADILTAVLAAVLALMLTRTVSLRQARSALDLDVLVTIAAAIGLGAAVTASGLSGLLADGIVGVANGAGAAGAVLAIVFGTLLLTELVTNVAAAALMVPIAIDVAVQSELDPRRMAVAVAVTASASFLTPIGYQTNTIVYGLGGYRFTDYWRLGAPLTVVVAALVTVLTVA